MTIGATQVKELRERTGVGMMECKKALLETNGDMDKAILWLRERGLSRAAQKATRVAAQGVVAVAISEDQSKGLVLEVNCETDFVAKGDEFRNFVQDLARHAVRAGVKDGDALKTMKLPSGQNAADALAALVAKIGENMQIRRCQILTTSNGVVAGYVHGEGKIGTLVALEGAKGDNVAGAAKDLAMHVAAASPRYLNSQSIPAAELEQEKALSRKKLADEKKPPEIVEKILTGQMQKFFKEVCLTEQPFVKNPDESVTKHLQSVNPALKITAFARYGLGEGIQKKEENFAAEVAATLNQ